MSVLLGEGRFTAECMQTVRRRHCPMCWSMSLCLPLRRTRSGGPLCGPCSGPGRSEMGTRPQRGCPACPGSVVDLVPSQDFSPLSVSPRVRLCRKAEKQNRTGLWTDQTIRLYCRPPVHIWKVEYKRLFLKYYFFIGTYNRSRS